MKPQFRYTARRSQVRSPAEYRRLDRLRLESQAAVGTKKEGVARAKEMVANGEKDFTPRNFTPQKGDDYRGIDFRGAKFNGQNFHNVKIDRAQGADFSFATIKGGSMAGGFAGASLRGAWLTDVQAAGAGLANVNAAGVHMSGVCLSGARAHGINLNGAQIAATNFCDADFDNMTMRGGSLTYSVGNRASLKGAVMTGFTLEDADFHEIDGQNMTFTPRPKAGDKDLNANFFGAKVDGATLSVAAAVKFQQDGVDLTNTRQAEDELDDAQPRPAARRRNGRDYAGMHRSPARATRPTPRPAYNPLLQLVAA